MGIFSKDDGRGIERWFIELPDEAKDLLVYKWPDQQLRAGSKVTVDADYSAVFTSHGKVVAVLPPGYHELEAGASKFTGWIADHLTSDRSIDAELFFVASREAVAFPFGGYVDTIRDPESSLVLRLRVFGECSWQVADPVALLTRIVGTDGVDEDEAAPAWVRAQILAAVREEAAEMLSEKGVLALGAWQEQLEGEVADKANVTLASYGLKVNGFGQLNLNVEDEDASKLSALAERAAYVKMAGGYEQYARAEALINLGNGGGGDAGLAGLLLLGGLDGLKSGLPSSAVPVTICWSCQNPITGTFCASCGAKQVCPNCDTPLAGGPFCSACGTKQ